MGAQKKEFLYQRAFQIENFTIYMNLYCWECW